MLCGPAADAVFVLKRRLCTAEEGTVNCEQDKRQDFIRKNETVKFGPHCQLTSFEYLSTTLG